MSEWITDEKPPVGETVLVSQVYGRKRSEPCGEVTLGMWNGRFWTWYMFRSDWNNYSIMDHGDVCPGNEYVDAWMPLPKAWSRG